jgi:hypothetical protein
LWWWWLWCDLISYQVEFKKFKSKKGKKRKVEKQILIQDQLSGEGRKWSQTRWESTSTMLEKLKKSELELNHGWVKTELTSHPTRRRRPHKPPRPK